MKTCVAPLDLSYCAASNKRLAGIAIEAGLRYGAQLPSTDVHFPIEFADQDWRKPDREKYMAALRTTRPRMATVLDWEHEHQFNEIMGWAEDAAAIVDHIVIIPKVWGEIDRIPTHIGGKQVRLGIPCGPQQGKAPPIWEFGKRPVHVLGGQPHRQMALAKYLNVVSVDCSTTAYMARLKCAFWTPIRDIRAKDRWWIQLQEIGLGKFGKDSLYEAFARSCQNVIRGWEMFKRGEL